MNEKYLPITLKVHYRNNLDIFWDDFAELDCCFRQEVGLDRGDVEKARIALERGTRANVFAFTKENAIGFRRLDFNLDTFSLGAIYVKPSFRDYKCMLESISWLEYCTGYKLWQFLTMASQIIGRRAGYERKNIGTYIHNENGERVKRWRMQKSHEWELEVSRIEEPKELIDLIRQSHTVLSDTVNLSGYEF